MNLLELIELLSRRLLNLCRIKELGLAIQLCMFLLSDLHDQQEHPAISFRFSADRRFLLSEGTLEVCGAVIGV